MSIEAERVREYKRNGAFKQDGIDYARVIATRAYDPSLKNTIKEYIRLCSYQFVFSLCESDNSKMIFVYSYRGKGRSDFDSIFDTAEGFATNAGISHDVYNGIYKFSLKNVFKIIKPFPLWVKFRRQNVKYPFYASILVAQFLEFRKVFEKVLNTHSYKACVTFCDAHGVENMFTQMANAKGIKTATLQHGQYRILPKDNEVADVEAYENFISNYLLAWGEMTQEEFSSVGIDSGRIIPVGAIKGFSKNEKINEHRKQGVFGVVLCGNVYEKTNLNMISLANEIAHTYGMKYILRMHPKNDENYYVGKCDKECLEKAIKKIENYEYAEMVDFSILHMTGVFVELLSINSPMFIFSDENMADLFKIDNATFTSFKEFEIVYGEFLNHEDEFKSKQYALYRKFNRTGNLEEQYVTAYNKYLLK